MELRQLEYLVAVAEEANFTRAADREHVSQSGISAQIRQLERQLGAELIDRSGRVARLTPAGQAALEHARAALAAVESLRRAVDEINGLVRGRLAVGMLNGSAVIGLIDALAVFRERHNGVSVTLTEDTTDPLTEQVRSGDIDIALIAVGDTLPADIESMVVADDRIVAVVPTSHPLARRKQVPLAELARFPIVTMPSGTAVRAMFDGSCSRHGVAVDVVLQASAPEAVAQLAIRLVGVGIVPESLALHHRDQLVSLAIRELRAGARLALVWKPGANPALSAFVEVCRQGFASPT